MYVTCSIQRKGSSNDHTGSSNRVQYLDLKLYLNILMHILQFHHNTCLFGVHCGLQAMPCITQQAVSRYKRLRVD